MIARRWLMFAAAIVEFWNTLYFSCHTLAFVILILAHDFCVCVCVCPLLLLKCWSDTK